MTLANDNHSHNGKDMSGKTVRYELREGIDGSGNTIYLVSSFDSAERCTWIERFKSKKEAEAWIKYSC